MTTTEIAVLGKNEDALNTDEAIIYLASIGVRISRGTLLNRISKGTGPERSKRNGRWFFKKASLDAWKKQETDVKGAYIK